MTETIEKKNARLLKAGFDFFERLSKDPENNMFVNAIEVGLLIKKTEDRVTAEYQERIRQLEEALRAWEKWEANLILTGSDKLWNELGDISEIQAIRNAALEAKP